MFHSRGRGAMNKPNLKRASIAAICGAALFAAMPFAAGTAAAADLPLVAKAPPKAPDPANLF
jgi:hypothetical protein